MESEQGHLHPPPPPAVLGLQPSALVDLDPIPGDRGSQQGEEIILRAEDVKDWAYKGEGGANLVLSYWGSSPFLVGKILRIQKVQKGKTRFVNGCSFLSSHEKVIWRDVNDLMECSSKEKAGQLYVAHVMSNLLGSKHIDEGVFVKVSSEFFEAVEKNICSQRPTWRISASQIDTIGDSALLVSDHSLFNDMNRSEFCISVEIKPKCGFLPSSDFIAGTNAVKKSVTRFRMHQFLKLHLGEISRVSEYDPLDLFSASKDRMNKALMSLFAIPQNNFRIFLNGSLVYGGLGGGLGNAPIQFDKSKEAIEDLIRGSGLELSSLFELIVEAIEKTGILDRLLATQQLDVFDIEGVIHAYYDVISHPCMVCKCLSDPELLNHYSLLHSLSREESSKHVRDYLIAGTAKDCSLMFCFRPMKDKNSTSAYDSILLRSSNKRFDYKAHFIDLDMKPLEKMVHYYELDQKIVKFYKKIKEIEGKPAIQDMKANPRDGNRVTTNS